MVSFAVGGCLGASVDVVLVLDLKLLPLIRCLKKPLGLFMYFSKASEGSAVECSSEELEC